MGLFCDLILKFPNIYYLQDAIPMLHPNANGIRIDDTV